MSEQTWIKIGGLKPNTEYIFSVKTSTDRGESAWSIWKLAKTLPQGEPRTEKPKVCIIDVDAIAQFSKKIQELLLVKLQQAQPEPKRPFREFLREHFGQAHQSDSSGVSVSENGDRLNHVADQMAKLALGGDSDEVWQRYAEPYGPTKVDHVSIDSFQVDAETVADRIWQEIKLKSSADHVSIDRFQVDAETVADRIWQEIKLKSSASIGTN